MVMLQIQKRINAVIEARRKAGEDLPPAPKTAIAGPEFFGFNQPEVRLLCCNPDCQRLYMIHLQASTSAGTGMLGGAQVMLAA